MAQMLGKKVGPIGLGLMGFSWRPDPIPIEKAIETLKAAFESGATVWNGAEFYGTPEYNSMTILNRYFTQYPEHADKVTLIIKGAVDPITIQPDGSPEGIRRSVDNILKQLGGKKRLDSFGIGRRDVSSSFETTLRVLKEEYVDTGKIGGVSLSECSAATIEEAAKIIDVAAVEVELSMFSPDILHNGVAAACGKHNIPITAYSPMSRGMLTGRFKTNADAQYLGRLATFPRFRDESLAHNLKLVAKVEALAEKKGCTSAQMAIAWVSHVGARAGMPDIIPIPGSTSVSRVQENSKVIELTKEELKEVDDILENFTIAGGRYPDGVPTEL